MFGSVLLFPIYGLDKIRQMYRFYICRLVNCLEIFSERGYLARHRRTSKGMPHLLARHSKLFFFNCVSEMCKIF